MSEIINKIKNILNKNNPYIIEIGACSGEDSKRFLETFPNVVLRCFEADPRNIELFKKYIGDDERCQLIYAAISNIDGEINFHQSFGPRQQYLPGVGQVERQASGSIRKPKEHLNRHKWCKFNDGIKVPSIKLDTWFWEKAKFIDPEIIDLLWVDVNGAELDLINGGIKTLNECTRYFYTECSPPGIEIYEGGLTKKDIMNLLPNFEEVFEYKNNVLLRNKNI